ncbi:NADPH-dependent aldehyde reductase 1, chloroplastic-like [Wolffia australiana]
MAAREQAFPPQRQEKQPGKEHILEPRPQPTMGDYTPSNKLRGKVALVTGGDSGIGRAVCHVFALEGATVAFTYVKGEEERDAEETLEMLRGAKTGEAKEAMAIAADLGYEYACKKVVDDVVTAWGRIDVLVNNAAEQHVAPDLEHIDEARLERVLRTNLFSYFFMSKHCLPHMRAGSAIINTTSVNAYKGHPTLLDYTASKGGVVAFTRALHVQVIGRGIRVNAVAPGPVWTPLIPASFPEDKVAQFGKDVPMGRAAQPSEIAPSFLFLACDRDSSYVAGQVLHPNGGVVVNG